mmetsp:Transcript_9108/g.27408  ORF Transcript_9108/g.27408 Transcript_9108/m.27408 type:complete len:117 (+) Transcript_9108:129-479(+)|eukprot:CAMPEP_0198733038 /NCGR_PEP_ID=MMETSP1475-20131203/42144_1 /TAXON_ID= ORGANISM="Unidentified sp., Strain CCMP1999" /NCGR_SAMPLE_ID=MMETSP1475 /ASSEMBLY_ACC=CAM_ASM_001111 /LENGTH=116 /DNA_ID=CAMNT_0044496261 /DNA_START=123 /DNA_END=473 /DNA_ORIENTATION=+
MPSLLITSSVDVDESKKLEMLKEGSKILSEAIGKPESYCMVSFQKATMIFGGTDDACAIVRVVSLGGLNQAVNREITARTSDLLEKYCGVQKNRMYVEFTDSKRDFFGFNGKTFAD